MANSNSPSRTKSPTTRNIVVCTHADCSFRVYSVTKKTTPLEIIGAAKLHHQVSITYGAAERAKKSLPGDDLESQAMQFRVLLAYVDAVCPADLRAHVRLSVEDCEGTRRFQRLFICTGIGHEAWRHCRPFIAMGGTFTVEILNLTVLLAASVDVNNHSVLLAWTIVESENESSWQFLLSNLCATIPEANHPTGWSSCSTGGRI